MFRFRAAFIVLVGLAIAGCSSDSPQTASTATPPTAAPTTTSTAAPTTTVAETIAPVTDGHIRGTAYTFNTPDPIAGATISLAELPEISAVTAADGSYELTVPAGSTVTPVIVADGHHSIHLQTFTLDADHDGTDVDGANFQTPTDAIYDGLRGLIEGFIGADPFDGGNNCVFVTTVSDKKVVGMNFDQFINFHPHGKAGATASIEPASVTPIYFNKDVLPDQAQLVTSNDGGVLWANVPPGEYTLSAQLDGTAFATAHATCEPGWVVNASPVQGLHELP